MVVNLTLYLKVLIELVINQRLTFSINCAIIILGRDETQPIFSQTRQKMARMEKFMKKVFVHFTKNTLEDSGFQLRRTKRSSLLSDAGDDRWYVAKPGQEPTAQVSLSSTEYYCAITGETIDPELNKAVVRLSIIEHVDNHTLCGEYVGKDWTATVQDSFDQNLIHLRANTQMTLTEVRDTFERLANGDFSPTKVFQKQAYVKTFGRATH